MNSSTVYLTLWFSFNCCLLSREHRFCFVLSFDMLKKNPRMSAHLKLCYIFYLILISWLVVCNAFKFECIGSLFSFWITYDIRNTKYESLHSINMWVFQLYIINWKCFFGPFSIPLLCSCLMICFYCRLANFSLMF